MLTSIILSLSLLAPPGSVVSGGDPYFLLLSRLEAADLVVLGTVQEVRLVEAYLKPPETRAVVAIQAYWQGTLQQEPQKVQVRNWGGPSADPDRVVPWVLFLARHSRDGKPWLELQHAVDLELLPGSRADAFKRRVASFQKVRGMPPGKGRRKATVMWLMEQIPDPESRESATYELERPALHRLLAPRQVERLFNVFCSLDEFDLIAGHLTDILNEVATDRQRFLRCALHLLASEAKQGSWALADLVAAITDSVAHGELFDLADAFLATEPPADLRGYHDTPELKEARRLVLARFVEVATAVLEGTDLEPAQPADGLADEVSDGG